MVPEHPTEENVGALVQRMSLSYQFNDDQVQWRAFMTLKIVWDDYPIFDCKAATEILARAGMEICS